MIAAELLMLPAAALLGLAGLSGQWGDAGKDGNQQTRRNSHYAHC